MVHNQLILSRDEVRELDRRAIEEYGIPGIVLMENAGRCIVDYLLSQDVQGNIIVCCGKGNNAGDGFVIARHLSNQDLSLQVLLFAKPDKLTGDAKTNFEILVKSSIPIIIVDDKNFNSVLNDILPNANWIIDALFGTGLYGTVQPPFDKIIQAINKANKKTLSVDIPSGLDCDSGEPLGVAVKATHTVTFVAYKKGFMNPQAKKYLGNIHVVNIGLPKVLI